MTNHQEGVTNPEAPPARGAGRYGDVLTVDRHGLRWSLTHRTPRKERR